MSTCRRINGHKFTAICPIKDCNYTSRIPYTSFLNNTNSTHSKTCPKHQKELINQTTKK